MPSCGSSQITRGSAIAIPIHEFVALDGSVRGGPAIASEVHIIHRGYLKDVMRDRNKSERNLALAEAALRRDDTDPFNWYNYGSSAILSKQFDEAIAAFERMRELCTNQRFAFVPSGLTMLAELYHNERKDAASAERVAREAVERIPSFTNARFILGKALATQRRFAEAREQFMAAIEAGKSADEQFFVDNEVSMWKAHGEIGSSLMEEGGFDLALAWFEFALKNRPRVPVLRQRHAAALEKLGRLDEADAELRSLWEDERNELAATGYLNFLLRCGRDREAIAYVLDAAPSLGPENRLIFYGSAAAVAGRAGLPGRESHVELALGRPRARPPRRTPEGPLRPLRGLELGRPPAPADGAGWGDPAHHPRHGSALSL